MSLTRVRPVNPIRSALETALQTPRVQMAVGLFVAALVDEGEAVLKRRYAGEILRIYTPKGPGAQARDERDLRIVAALAAGQAPAAVAARESVTVRRVQQIGAQARRAADLVAPPAKSSA